jgi:hypothetical protein
MRLFQNFSFWNSYLEFRGKTGLLTGFSKSLFKTNRVLEQAQITNEKTKALALRGALIPWRFFRYTATLIIIKNPAVAGFFGREEKVLRTFLILQGVCYPRGLRPAIIGVEIEPSQGAGY